MRGSWPIFYFFERLSTPSFSSNSRSPPLLSFSHRSGDSIPHKPRTSSQAGTCSTNGSVMQGSASREGSEGRGSDGRGGDAAPTTSEPTGLDLDNSLDDALSSPPVPAAPEPYAALAVLCRKAAAEAVSSIKFSRKLQPREGGESSTNDIEESSDLETTLALGRLALVLSSSSSSSSSSPPPPLLRPPLCERSMPPC